MLAVIQSSLCFSAILPLPQASHQEAHSVAWGPRAPSAGPGLLHPLGTVAKPFQSSPSFLLREML